MELSGRGADGVGAPGVGAPGVGAPGARLNGAGANGALSLTLSGRPSLGVADRRCAGWLWLFLLAFYLLTMAGRVISSDGETMYQTTRALVLDGRLAIESRPETAPGQDGRHYSKYGLGQSLVQAPFFVAGHGAGKLLGAVDDRLARFTVGMTNAVVTATLVVVFWLLLRELRIARGVATGAALVLGGCTILWPYARSDFSEPLQALTMLLALYCLVRWRRAGTVWWAAGVGVAAGAAFLTKAATAVLLPALGVYFLGAAWEHVRRSEGRLALRHSRHATRSSIYMVTAAAAAAAAPFAACVVFQAWLNVYRFGSVTEFGYGDEPVNGFTTPLLLGIHHLLLSSGKGLFLFAPPVLLGLAALPWLARRHALEAAAVALVFLGQLLYYGRWWAWHGDWSWGPRYLVLTVPFVMLGWGPFLAAWPRLGVGLRVLAGLLAAAGCYVSLLGVIVDYGRYYSVVGPQLQRGVNVVEARLIPEFSPILGHAWLARASLYELLMDLRGRDGEAQGVDILARAAETNPYLDDYPWRQAYPEARPEAPARALGLDLWFVALRDRPPFVTYWSGLVAAWLALTLVMLGVRLRAAARSTAAGGLEADVATTTRAAEVAAL